MEKVFLDLLKDRCVKKSDPSHWDHSDGLYTHMQNWSARREIYTMSTDSAFLPVNPEFEKSPDSNLDCLHAFNIYCYLSRRGGCTFHVIFNLNAKGKLIGELKIRENGTILHVGM